MSKKIFVLIALYILPAFLFLELLSKSRGTIPIANNSNNNIFYGILDRCSNSAYLPNSRDVAKLDRNECDTKQLSSILNIKSNFSTSFISGEFNTRININNNGFRLPNSGINSNILVMGDSFTYGHGVEGEERFSWLLQGMCRQPILNSSYMNGFQPEHYMHYFRVNKSLTPEIAIINLFVSNDLSSDVNETVISGTGGVVELPGRSITHGGSLGGIAQTPKFNAVYQVLLRLARYSSLAQSMRVKLLYTGIFGILPPNSPPPKELVQDGSISSPVLARVANSLNEFDRIGKLRNESFTLYVALIPDSLTDLNFQRMKKVNGLIRKQLSQALNKKIHLVDIAESLEAKDFYPGDRHYNAMGHIKHANALLTKLTRHSINTCK